MKKGKRRKKKIITVLILVCLVVAIAVYLFIIRNSKQGGGGYENSKNHVKEKPITIVDINSNKRPIAVMIDNNVGNNSHVGLQEAYISYEIIVEGGLTRIMAIYKDRDIDQIGPIRSARHYFLDYALENDAIYCHYGWSPYAEADIKNLSVNNINGLTASSAYWRDKNIRAPHNVFTSIDRLYKYANSLSYSRQSDNWQLLKYSGNLIKLEDLATVDENSEAMVASKININYSLSQSRQYNYDSEKKVYVRFMNNKPHIDKKSGQQYNYKNIIIEKVSNRTMDSDGRQDLTTTGSGDGYYITNGYALPITWYKGSRRSKTKYKYLDGKEVKFNDRNTFIQVIPTNADTTIE